MTDTINLGLPCIEGSQAQKHVTHNDALRILDTLVQLAVADRDLTAPPGSPAEGQRWIVKASATGAWTGHDNAIAAWQDGGWQFSAPQTGWCAFVADEAVLVIWNGTAWGDFFAVIGSIQNLIHLGVGTTADDTNPLSAKLNNTLFVAKTAAEGGDGNLRYNLSKESAAKTLSFLLQDNYSGRAEIGLTGDDDFHFKVSPDGSTWYEGLKIDGATGKPSFPVGTAAVGFRANRNGTDQTGVASATTTLVSFNNEVFDDGNCFDTTNAKWTPPAGLVWLGAQIRVINGLIAAGTQVFCQIRKNGTAVVNGIVVEPVANGAVVVPVAVVDNANGSDYYDVVVNTATTSGTYDVSGAAAASYFSGHVIR